MRVDDQIIRLTPGPSYEARHRGCVISPQHSYHRLSSVSTPGSSTHEPPSHLSPRSDFAPRSEVWRPAAVSGKTRRLLRINRLGQLNFLPSRTSPINYPQVPMAAAFLPHSLHPIEIPTNGSASHQVPVRIPSSFPTLNLKFPVV